MAGRERLVITIRKTLSVEAITKKGIAVSLLGTDDTEYLVQLPSAEARGLAEMITIALGSVK